MSVGAPSRDGLSSPTEPQSAQGLGPAGFDPSRWAGPRYSPNLNRWLAKQARRRGGLWGPPRVYVDAEKRRWIGIHDDDAWFYGAQLLRCLTVGAKAEVFAHPPGSLGLTEEGDFWPQYDRLGRCHIDPAHSGWWATEGERWQIDGDTRSCRWCGEHRQRLRRWAETVERERWEPCDRDGAEGGDAKAAPVPQDRQARAEGIAHPHGRDQ